MAGPYGTPRTWSAGERPTASQFNAEIRDWVSALANPPSCRVYHNTTQSLAHATETTLAFNSERYDTDTMHDTSTNNSRITFNTAGLYQVNACIEIANSTDYTFFFAFIALNAGLTALVAAGSQMADAADLIPILTMSTVYKFAAGDFIQVRAQQNNGASAARNLTANSNRSPEFSATWLGKG